MLPAARAALLAGVLLLFWPAGDNLFTNFDDDLYVTGNAAVQRGLDAASVRWAFTTFHAGNWHPLTWLSHLLDQELFGSAPRGHHLTSVALHAGKQLLDHRGARRAGDERPLGVLEHVLVIAFEHGEIGGAAESVAQAGEALALFLEGAAGLEAEFDA